MVASQYSRGMDSFEEVTRMLLGKPFAQFVEDSPISVMMRGVVEYAFEAKRLDDLFE